MSSGPITVLHVDDEPALTELVATFLHRENDRLTVQTATSASEGLARLSESGFDCIVSDYEMPGQSGIEFFQSVRETDCEIPFILYTGKGSEEVASDAIAAGVTDYLQKRSGSEQYELLANRITNAVEQHRSTRRAAELERVRQVIRNANQALVRAETRAEIEHRLCEIISDADPYRFAWIGEYDPKSRSISPSTAVGFDESYLDGIEITSDERPTGQGPTGQAVRDRELSVVQNIPENAAFEPWRADALERGYQSSAAIPISRDDTLYGILNVYADRIEAFDDEEQKLLQELADDTAHALYRLESRERLQSYGRLVENLPVGIYRATPEPDGEVIDVNPALADMLGADSQEQLEGRSVRDFYYDPTERDALSDELQQTGLVEGKVLRQKTLDGDEIWVSVTAIRTEENGETYFDGIVWDITERMERDRDLQQAKERLNLALGATNTGIWEWNLETGEVRWDATLEQSVGLDPGAFEGTREAFEQRVHPDDWPDVEEAISQAIANDELYEIQFRMHHEGGGVIWAGVRGQLVGGDGAAERMIGVHHDITEQKEWKRELKHQNAKFRGVFEESFDAMIIADDDGRSLDANESATDLFGVAREELIGRSIAEFVPDDFDFDGAWHEFQASDGKRGVFPLVRPDGKRYVEYAVTKNIAPGQHLSVLRDITDRKERERRYDAIFNQTYQFTGLLEPDGTLLEANETVLKFGGIDREDVIGEKIWDSYWFQHSAETNEQVRDAVSRAAEGEFVRLELPIRGSDGEVIIDFSVRPILNDEGEVLFLIPEGRDITERKEHERELRRRAKELEEVTARLDEQYRTLFEEAPVMTVVTRAEDGRPIIEDSNERFLDTLGYDKEAVLGRDLTELYTPDSREQLLEGGGYRRSLEDEFTRERRDMLTADGEIVDTLLRAVPHRDSSGEVVGTLAMYIDITEQEDLKRVNERLEEFTRIVSHDLRNPMTVAAGRLELAQQDCDSEHLDVVGRAHGRMDALITDLLTLARNGTQIEAAEIVSLEDVATDCWEQVATGQATMVAESERLLRADRSRLQQLLENLMRNAIEHGDEDVTVTVGDLADGFYVEDDGTGISPADRDDVFEAGYSTDATGTGFGLSIVKQIVEAHGWEINVTDGTDGGARFEITDIEFAAV